MGFARLPDEEPAFLAYLAKSGDVWARATRDDMRTPRFAPAPIIEFIRDFSTVLTDEARNENPHAATVDLYIGLRADVMNPVASTAPGAEHDVGIMESCLVGYKRGMFYAGGELAQSNLYFYRSFFRGEASVIKPTVFLEWAGKVLAWVRRHTPEKVPVHRCNYRTRATTSVADKCRGGLKVWY